MRKGFLPVVLALFVFYWIPAYAATLSPAAVPRVPKAAAPAAPIPAPPPPANLSVLNITVPNGGEKWLIGSTKNITWTTNLNGYCMVELYRGSTSPQTRVGMVASGTQISNKTISWKVGSYDGGTGTAPPGNDYWIVIKSEAVAKNDASNGPFTLMAVTASPSASTPLVSTDKKELSKIPPGLKSLSLTYPRRADGFHKGILYKITWKSLNLNDAKLKLELLDNQETTVIQNIAENFENKGEKLWDVPMTLPDEQKLYKIRIQTMDGTKSDTVGPIKIAKGPTPAGSPTLKVTNPGTGDRAIGDTIPVKWTSATTCSGDGGPLDDGFRIDLIGKMTNSVNVSTLLKDPGQDVFDSEGPTGVLNWHWDWWIAPGGNYQPGTYQIRVKNGNGKCTGMSEPFRLKYPQERKDYVMPAKKYNMCYFHLLKLNYTGAGTGYLIRDLGHNEMAGIPNHALVGFRFFQNTEKMMQDFFILRSWASFSDDPHWYKQLGSLQEAKLIIERKWKTTNQKDAVHPCLGGVALLNAQPLCDESFAVRIAPPLSGTIPVNTSQGDVWEVDVTAHYLALTNQGKPDYGIVLYPSLMSPPGPCNTKPWCNPMNAESYKVTLKTRFINKAK